MHENSKQSSGVCSSAVAQRSNKALFSSINVDNSISNLINISAFGNAAKHCGQRKPSASFVDGDDDNSLSFVDDAKLDRLSYIFFENHMEKNGRSEQTNYEILNK
ncbi:hypothetical protein DERP_013807 [Dermatophagoides pteronyssinus]|uniref:Uncharacterized protein n=1 Tax=Dermatophagoides pteronyssinus TaxID=6956 RepID=A0ABQ8JCP1_DERPT|nr:hypothetical protein DERP_013807 [Dermatophagoides pteronyssinus]